MSKNKKIVQPKSKEPINTEKKLSFFDSLNNKAIYLTLLITLLIAFFIFKDFLFFEKAYLFKDIGSDTFNANLPYLSLLINYFNEYGTLSWSFSNGMGQSIYPLFLRDPFDLIAFLGGADKIYYVLGLKEFIKIIIGAFLFYLFIEKLNLNNYTKIIGALLFAFCGFMIVGGGWYVFSYEALNLVLLLLGFELLFQNNKVLVFVLAIFLLAVSMPFNLYIYGSFLIVYSFLRYYTTNDKFNLKEAAFLYLKMSLYGVIGICLAGPILLENINQILESPRGSGENSYFHQLASMPMFELSTKLEFGTGIMRFFSSDILGTGNNFRGWGNTLEAPLFYCGLPCLLLLPQLFGFLNKKNKIAFFVFIGVVCLPIIFPYFRRAFWLFSGDYYRSYAFFVALTFLICSLIALDYIIKNKKINITVLAITVVLLFILLSYPYFENSNIVVSGISIFVKLFIVVYAVILFLLPKSKNMATVLFVFLFLVCIELFYFSNTSINKRDAIKTSELKQKNGYNDYTLEAAKFVRDNDKSFFRVDKNYYSSPAMHGSLNDAMIQKYYGTSCYNGFAEKSYIDYLKNYNIISEKNEAEARWAAGLSNRIILESINSVKYLFIKNNGNVNPAFQYSHDSIAQFGDVKVLKNKNNLPLGFCYNKFIKQSDFKKMSAFQKDFVSLNALVIADEDVGEVKDLTPFLLEDTLSAQNFTWEKYAGLISDLKKDTLKITSFKESNIKANITVANNKVVYFSIPYNKAWKIKVNNNEIKPILVARGMMGVPVSKGENSIELQFAHLYTQQGIALSVIALLGLFSLFFFKRKKTN